MLEGDADVDDERRRIMSLSERPAVDDLQVHHVVAEVARQGPLDADHIAGKILVGAIAATTFAVAISASSLSLGVVAVEMVVGLILVTDAWGLRKRLPFIKSEGRRQAAIGWSTVVMLAVILRQVVALWS